MRIERHRGHMPKAQYQKRMNRGGRSTGGGGGSTSVSGGGTIPETVSAQTGNTIDTAGRHTHAVLASSNPGNHEVLLKTDADGQLHLLGAELDQLNPTSVLFQEDGIAIIGGSLAIVPDSGYLAATVDSAATTIDFGRQMTPGHFVIIRGVTASRNRAVEFLQVGALVSGTTYNVTRDVTGLNATDPSWPAKMPFAVLGAQGAGRLWMTTKPPRYRLQIQGATANTYTDVVGIGDLNGNWGYSSSTYGMALGEFAAGKANLTWDPTNGLRIRRHTDTLFQVDNNGHATIAGWELDPGHLAKNGVILNSAGYLLLGLGSDIIRLDAQHSHWRMWAGAVTGDDAPFGVTKAGAIKATAGTIGGWALSQNSIVGAGMVLGAGTGYLHAGDIEGGDVLVIDSSDDTHRLWAGAKLKLDAPFAILKDGSIKATAGTIGGWTLSATGLYSGEGTNRVALTVANPTYRFWAGAVSAAEAPFSVTKEGVIKATAGTIGGWTLSATGLYSGEGTNRVVLTVSNPTYRFWAGAVSAAEASFRLSATGALDTAQYIAGLRGWRISEIGDAEFNNVSVRGELHSAVMVYGEQHATAGTLVIAKSAGKLKEDVTTLAHPTTFFVRIEDPDTGPVQLFELFDYLRIKDGSGNDNWLEVRGITRSADHWRYNCWLRSGTPTTFRAGAVVVDYGQAGDGYLIMSADAEDGPYYDVQTHAGAPWTTTTTNVRLGNLAGITDADLSPTGYGLYCDNVFLKGSLIAGAGNIILNADGIEILANNTQIDLNSYKFSHAGTVFGGVYGRSETNPPYLFNVTEVLLSSRSPDGMDASIYISTYAPTGRVARLDLTCTAAGADNPPGIYMLNSSLSSYLDVRIAGRNNRFSAAGVVLPGGIDANLFFVDASTDRVGIGTSSPAAKLDVRGDAVFTGDVNTAQNLLPQGYLLREKSPTVQAQVARCGQEVGVEADTYTSLMTFSTTDGQFSAYRGVFTGLLTVSGHMRTSGGSARFIAGVWLITIYKWANYNLALMSTLLGSHNTGSGGETIAIRSAEATATSLVIQAKINCTNFDSGSIVWGLRGECGSTEAASIIALSEEAEEIVEPDPPDPPPPPPPPPAGLVPGHYWMLDAGAVDRELATALFYWSELEPTAGNYNWSIVDSWLDDHPNGIIQVFFHTSGMTGDVNFQLWLPPGVPYYTITNSGKTAYIPAYDQTAFRSRYISFINAFGARYDGQPVIACLGLDGESQCAKTQDGVDWITACYGTDANAVPYRFRTTYLDAILEAYRDAFPNSTVLVNCAPGGTDTRKRVLPLAIDLGLGLKHSGVIDDTDSWLGYDASGNPPTLAGVLNGTYTGLLGLWDIIRMGYEAGLTIVTESAYGMCPDPMKAVYAALSYHPTAMTWHKEWFNSLLTESQLDWAELYLGRTKSTTPGVWWAHHQSVYPKIAVGSSGYYSGHGHCEFWLYQTNSTTWTVDSGVTLSNVRVSVEYTGTGTMTINGQNYSLGASGSAYADITSAVTQVTVTGAQVRFIEIRKLSY
jgi:hypothetical protein